MKYGNGFVLHPEECITQQIVVENSGKVVWPFDTYMVFSGKKNELNLAEETYVGMLEPSKRTIISIDVKTPSAKKLKHEPSFTFEFELRHSF